MILPLQIAKLEAELEDKSVTLEAVKVQWEHELSESIQLKEKVRQLEPRSKLGERAEEYFAKMVEAQQVSTFQIPKLHDLLYILLTSLSRYALLILPPERRNNSRGGFGFLGGPAGSFVMHTVS